MRPARFVDLLNGVAALHHSSLLEQRRLLDAAYFRENDRSVRGQGFRKNPTRVTIGPGFSTVAAGFGRRSRFQANRLPYRGRAGRGAERVRFFGNCAGSLKRVVFWGKICTTVPEQKFGSPHALAAGTNPYPGAKRERGLVLSQILRGIVYDDIFQDIFETSALVIRINIQGADFAVISSARRLSRRFHSH